MLMYKLHVRYSEVCFNWCMCMCVLGVYGVLGVCVYVCVCMCHVFPTNGEGHSC